MFFGQYKDKNNFDYFSLLVSFSLF